MYAQLGSPRGAFLLLRRALQDDDLSAAVNLKVGEQFDTGARHFLPMFPAALYFYQRAARAGSVHAMLAIAQLYLRGCTSSTMLSVKQMESLRSVEKYQGWLQQAMDRGCGSAYFVKGCAHLKGEHGCTKSYALAKEYLDMATSSQPNIARRAPQVYVMLEKLREEEEGEGEGKPKGCSSVSGMVSSSADKSGNRIEDSGVVVSSSLERLKNIKSKLGTTNSSSSINTLGLRKAKAYRSGAKAFWEGAATTGLTLYSLYTLAFPIRVILLPHFYTLLGHLVDRVPWLASNPPTPF
ncbi:hypothetical protein ERJ75_001256600 [Trypanosoma vivax]|nr:hypothetical protein ERJ75_001256600 [Trypanosoma vivax]